MKDSLKFATEAVKNAEVMFAYWNLSTSSAAYIYAMLPLFLQLASMPASDGGISLAILACLFVSCLCLLVSELSQNYSQTDKLWSLTPPIYGVYSHNIILCTAPKKPLHPHSNIHILPLHSPLLLVL